MVVVGFTGQHHTVGVGAARTGCRPTWWPAGGNRWRPGCSAGHSGRRHRPRSRRFTQVVQTPVEDRARRAARCRRSTPRGGAAGSTVAVDDAVVRQQPLPVGERRAGADSMGIPTVADRTAATTHPLDSAGATDANDASPHSGAALRQRRGAPARRRSRRPSRRRSSGRASAGAVNRTAPEARSADRAPATHRDRRAQPTQMPAHQTSQASRTPEKICRRIGWSQLRKLGRRMLGADRPGPAAQHPVVAARRTARCSGRRSSG